MKYKLNHITNTAKETQEFGKKLAKEILEKGLKKTALIVGLEGDLGSGKTTFLQGFARGLGIKEKILSPTFVIIKKFQVSSFKFQRFYHIDCYRIQKPKEILDLGFKEIILNPKNIIAIEWSERIKKVLPREIILLRFKFIDKNKREISFAIDVAKW